MTSIFTKTMRWWMPVVMLCGFISNATAQKYSNEFLSIGVGARAQGMGMAVIAGGSDVTSGVWNPAGLAG
ncbi:MAG TPA: hypothetical protein PLL53_06815, partial [Saprospiraceae bacterium]|nr:hypothetical protein [Saprospiraceae bacterium]